MQTARQYANDVAKEAVRLQETRHTSTGSGQAATNLAVADADTGRDSQAHLLLREDKKLGGSGSSAQGAGPAEGGGAIMRISDRSSEPAFSSSPLQSISKARGVGGRQDSEHGQIGSDGIRVFGTSHRNSDTSTRRYEALRNDGDDREQRDSNAGARPYTVVDHHHENVQRRRGERSDDEGSVEKRGTMASKDKNVTVWDEEYYTQRNSHEWQNEDCDEADPDYQDTAATQSTRKKNRVGATAGTRMSRKPPSGTASTFASATTTAVTPSNKRNLSQKLSGSASAEKGRQGSLKPAAGGAAVGRASRKTSVSPAPGGSRRISASPSTSRGRLSAAGGSDQEYPIRSGMITRARSQSPAAIYRTASATTTSESEFDYPGMSARRVISGIHERKSYTSPSRLRRASSINSDSDAKRNYTLLPSRIQRSTSLTSDSDDYLNYVNMGAISGTNFTAQSGTRNMTSSPRPIRRATSSTSHSDYEYPATTMAGNSVVPSSSVPKYSSPPPRIRTAAWSDSGFSADANASYQNDGRSGAVAARNNSSSPRRYRQNASILTDLDHENHTINPISGTFTRTKKNFLSPTISSMNRKVSVSDASEQRLSASREDIGFNDDKNKRVRPSAELNRRVSIGVDASPRQSLSLSQTDAVTPSTWRSNQGRNNSFGRNTEKFLGETNNNVGQFGTPRRQIASPPSISTLSLSDSLGDLWRGVNTPDGDRSAGRNCDRRISFRYFFSVFFF
jgi:hypothetical protein